MMILFVLITAILTIFLSVAVYNFYTAPLFIRTSRNKEFNSLISVLIPARNEEKNIRRILSDLVIQDYPDFEILVGNDNSEDGTGKILDEFAADYPFIKKVDIPPLEPGWKPKSFVLSELYKYSSGKLILFIDADVRLSREPCHQRPFT